MKARDDTKATRRRLRQWLAGKFLLEAAYSDELPGHLAAAFVREGGEYPYMGRAELDPIERKIAAGGCAVRAQIGDDTDGVRLSTLHGELRRSLERGAALYGETLEEFVDRDMLGW